MLLDNYAYAYKEMEFCGLMLIEILYSLIVSDFWVPVFWFDIKFHDYLTHENNLLK